MVLGNSSNRDNHIKDMINFVNFSLSIVIGIRITAGDPTMYQLLSSGLHGSIIYCLFYRRYIGILRRYVIMYLIGLILLLSELGAQNEEDSEGTEKDEEGEDEGEANEVEELPLPLFGNG
ncbi:MAG: hypothetical protein WCA61_09980 [Nitrososphaeraceae archaeon]